MGLIVLCKSQSGAFASSGFWTTAAQDLELSGCWGFGQPQINGAGLGALSVLGDAAGEGYGAASAESWLLAPQISASAGVKKAAYCPGLDNVVWLCREEGERQEEEALFTRWCPSRAARGAGLVWG